MLLMSQKIFAELSAQIENRLHALANYQFVMLKHVLINGTITKTDICKKLASANNTNDYNSFRNCPVFKVLVNKKLVKAYQDPSTRESEIEYSLHPKYDLTKLEINDLIKIVTMAKLRYESK